MKKTENEKWYDKEVAPKLAELANLCGDKGMAFVAVVEYNPGDRGETRLLPSESGLAMRMLAYCAKTGHNLDSYVFGLLRYFKEKGIDTSSSLVAQRINSWGKEGK